MARALSQVYTIIRGSVGGLTYTANQFHQIVVRARTAPVQPGTPPQTLIRSAFNDASITWKLLTPAQRISWANYATTAIFPGPLGDYTVPGRSIMMAGFSLATYLNEGGFAVNTPNGTPPLVTGFAGISNIKSVDPGVPTPSGFDISISNPQAEVLSVLVNISLGFDPSRNFYKGPWDSSLTLGANIPASSSVLIPITDLTLGQKYFFRVKGVITDGPHRITSEFFGNHIAASNP